MTPPAPRTSPASPAPPALGVATALVRAWTCAYTWRLEPAVRDARRAEIESDLWEFEHDPHRGSRPAAHVLTRLVIGIPDDLSWRAEHASARSTSPRLRFRAVAWTLATIILAVAWWILPLMTTSVLPPLPDAPRVVIKAPPPPGPPPPPPCAPASMPQFPGPCTP